ALIVFAGPATNILVTLAIFASFSVAYGKLEASTEVGGFSPVSAAREAGLKEGDRITAIDGDRIEQWGAITNKVIMFPSQTVQITLERDGQELTIPVKLAESLEKDRFGNESRVGRLGIYAAEPKVVPVGIGEAVPLAFKQTGDLVKMMVTGIGQIFTGDRSVRELGGPVKIAKYSGEQLSLGPQAFVAFAALISINLAFINLLPIPALDGGHLAFYAAEAIRRKPVGPQAMEWAYRTGIVLVLALMLFVTVNDIISLPLLGG
ncbi:MAG: RIP metalloprotease RseP, partial [Sphingomonadaceae bacterium]|nr:RIP metalloprotease RseP [Sphingomonadaceae bacterium]